MLILINYLLFQKSVPINYILFMEISFMEQRSRLDPRTSEFRSHILPFY